MSTSRHQKLARRKRRIEHRLRPIAWAAQPEPMYRASNLHYEFSDRLRGLDVGGIGAMHRLARHTGLVDAIAKYVHVLKRHLPYHESDHVLGIAYNVLCRGTCLQDIELRRPNEVYLDALGAQRIPDPTTAGDFCRGFVEPDIEAMQTAINETRRRVWRTQPDACFDDATIDADGTLAETTGHCKEGMDIAYNGAGTPVFRQYSGCCQNDTHTCALRSSKRKTLQPSDDADDVIGRSEGNEVPEASSVPGEAMAVNCLLALIAPWTLRTNGAAAEM